MNMAANPKDGATAVQASLLEAEPKGTAPSRRPYAPPVFQIFTVSTRYGRGRVLGYSRTWDRAVNRRESLGKATAAALKQAVEAGEGLEVVTT